VASAAAIPRLGVGLVFAPALRRFLEERPGLVDFLEIEPQTLWLADDPLHGPFFECTPALEGIARLPGARLVHSVGVPLGGGRPPDPRQCELIRSTAERLDSAWVSEHLSLGGTVHEASGFFLPPLQTEEGVDQCVRNIRAFRRSVGRPVAVETGVAYLPRREWEMEDGLFLAEVVAGADCGILLDLHNLYCNHRNGRIRLDRFLQQVPLDRVWEVHLAGGHQEHGFWLDSHSGPMPAELRAITAELISSLPNLGALTFEIYDTYLQNLDPAALEAIVADLRELWEGPRPRPPLAPRGFTWAPAEAGPAAGSPAPQPLPRPDPERWERGLTDAVWKAEPGCHPDPEAAAGLRLYAWLARSFRSSMLARALPHAIRYLLLRDGEAVDGVLASYFGAVAPRLYTPLEAEAFRDWLAERDRDELLAALMDFDVAQLRVIRSGEAQVVRFPGDPAAVFEALAQARLPEMPPPPAWELELLPDGFTLKDWDRLTPRSRSAPASGRP
jgi:uncharacterized protein (UPF0276 family)